MKYFFVLLLVVYLSVMVLSQECNPGCDCDEVYKSCPLPRNCMKSNPSNPHTFIQCDSDGNLFVMACATPDLVWCDETLTCEMP